MTCPRPGGRLRGALIGLATLFALAAPARAVDVDVPPERSRVDAIAEALRAEVERALGDCPGGALVVRVESELGDADRVNALVQALVGPTTAALASPADARWPTAHQASFASPPEEIAQYAGRLGYDVLVALELRVLGHYLEIRGATWTTADRARRGELSVRSRLDAELRQALGPLPRVTADTLVARTTELPGRGYWAVRAHDLDGDGRTELVAVSRDGVAVLRLGASRVGVRLVEVGRAPFPPDLPRAAERSRRPLATAIATPEGVVVRASEHAAPVRVTLSGERVRVTRASGPCGDEAYPLDGSCASRVTGRDHFGERLAGGERALAPFYARAVRRIRSADGQVLAYEAVVTPLGRLALRAGGRAVGAVGYGTALAMADLDDDGAVELLTSAASPAGAGDRLSLLRALPRGALLVVWRSEAIAGPIWIAERGDLDGDGLEELFAVEEPPDPRSGTARLWIVR